MFPTFLVGNFFMRRPVQWNYAAGAAHGSRGEQEKSVPARFEKADPCSGIMPLARRIGKTNLPYSITCGRPKKKTLNARLLEC